MSVGIPVKTRNLTWPSGTFEPNEAMVCDPVTLRAAWGTLPRSVVDALTTLGSAPPPTGGIQSEANSLGEVVSRVSENVGKV